LRADDSHVKSGKVRPGAVLGAGGACRFVPLFFFFPFPSFPSSTLLPLPLSSPRSSRPSRLAAGVLTPRTTSRSAAVYALTQWLNCSPIYVVNRDKTEVDQFIAAFAASSNDKFKPELVHVETVEEAEKLEAPGAFSTSLSVLSSCSSSALLRREGRWWLVGMTLTPLWSSLREQPTSSVPSPLSLPRLSRRSKPVPSLRSSCTPSVSPPFFSSSY
jgi:hypothetical protein